MNENNNYAESLLRRDGGFDCITLHHVNNNAILMAGQSNNIQSDNKANDIDTTGDNAAGSYASANSDATINLLAGAIAGFNQDAGITSSSSVNQYCQQLSSVMMSSQHNFS